MIIRYFLVFIGVLIYSVTFSQTFEVIDGDTVNYTDANGLKQGYWLIFNKTKKLPNYTDDQKVEEGKYKDGKKIGIWKGYHNNGVLKYEITYVDDIPNGYAKFYYKTGNICEEGLWKMNKWVGQYKYYYENGQTAYDFNYNSKGEREGVQKYFHENGNLMVVGTWVNGKESGKLTEYYENGEVKSEKTFIDGKCDNTKTVIYALKDSSKVAIKDDNKIKDIKDIKDKEHTEKIDSSKIDTGEKITNITAGDKNKELGVFNVTGEAILKNKHGQVTKEGYFVNGYLKDGKEYIYSANGELVKTLFYKKGKVTKVIEEKKSE